MGSSTTTTEPTEATRDLTENRPARRWTGEQIGQTRRQADEPSTDESTDGDGRTGGDGSTCRERTQEDESASEEPESREKREGSVEREW